MHIVQHVRIFNSEYFLYIAGRASDHGILNGGQARAKAAGNQVENTATQGRRLAEPSL